MIGLRSNLENIFMLKPPFDIIHCSWPRPISSNHDQWCSEPEWDAPRMPYLPQPYWTMLNEDICWTIDWCQLFNGNLKHWNAFQGGEMRGFQVVFRLRVRESGRMLIYYDDGCIIRRNREIIHTDLASHQLSSREICVQENDCLEVAQWQHAGSWRWGGCLAAERCTSPTELLRPYLSLVQKRLQFPDGPALKMYCNGNAPVRTLLGLYSIILNGCRPERVLIFGEHQWPLQNRQLFQELLPFATIVPTADVLKHLEEVGGSRLVEAAQRHWYVMKTCVALLYPPEEFCMMDDDVFVLDAVDDALSAFRTHNLVFGQDRDYSKVYLRPWQWLLGEGDQFRTGSFNAGLYWLRNRFEPGRLAREMLSTAPDQTSSVEWEQGFLAVRYAGESFYQLPTQRYLFPYFDGLPGGIFGYDYAANPCGFVSLHFAGLPEKPSDAAALFLMKAILDRHMAC